MIRIMRASAGSGKTFNLAMKYITLLFGKKDSHAYRHILAVTFTNKATDEMKSRILKELYVLSSDPRKSPYIDSFIPEMFPDGEEGVVRLRKTAKEILSNILHDYGAFSISTIDRFFQQTLKAFSREIGQFASYKVELDKKSLIDESVDRVLDSLTEDRKELLQWLTESAMEQVEKGGKYRLEDGLKKMAGRLKSDAHRCLVEKSGLDESAMYSYDNLLKTRKVCRSVKAEYVRTVKQRAGEVLSMLESCGVPPEMFSYKFMAKVKDYADLAPEDTVFPLTEAFMAKAADHEKWFSKKNMKLHDMVYPVLESPLEEFCRCFGDDYREYATAGILERQLYELGVAADIYREFDAILKERNVLSIDDSNVILKNIIDGSDTPFIYEKTGVRYENFLLDEFQDTSVVQWENFRPLIAESASKNEENLVVGDVKQSIYRWRGSDWGLLDHGVYEALGMYRIEETKLRSNFRSMRNIVDFNNGFFPFAAGELDRAYGKSDGRTISGIYSDVVQETGSAKKGDGIVNVAFCPADKELAIIHDTVSMLHSRGVPYGDMAVLVRKNDVGAEIASMLISESVPVVTDDSLDVKASSTVRRLVSLLSCIDNPEDSVNSYLAGLLNVEMPDDSPSLPEMCESLCRSLKKYDPEAFEAETTYVCSFVDCLLDYVSVYGNDLHGFLRHWDEINPHISSPSSADAVRIMSVHKSKGLDFRYVIFPYAEDVNLFKSEKVWCELKGDGSELGRKCAGIYDVTLSDRTASTMFRDDYLQEKKMQYIDNINTFYVALTRAVEGLFVIAETPSDKFLASFGNELPAYGNFSHILYSWLVKEGVAAGFVKTEEEDIACFGHGTLSENVGESAAPGAPQVMELPAIYESYPLNQPVPEDGLPRHDRLVCSTDSYDYFSDGGDGEVRADGPVSGMSARVKGVILHKILSEIKSPADIPQAVGRAERTGLIEKADTEPLTDFFVRKTEFAASKGWFPEDGAGVLTETEIIDTDGSVYRPDRVILHGDGSVSVVDYKFGAPKSSYLSQVERYAALWKRKGYGNVSSYLWYVMRDEIIEK